MGQFGPASGDSNIRLAWPTKATSFILQSSVNLGAGADWRAVDLPTPPTVIDGQYIVILSNAITSPQRFYRLSR